MSALYQIGEEEYVRANRLFCKRSIKVYVLWLLIALGLVVLAIMTGLNFIFILVCAVIGGIIGDLITWRVYAPRQTRRQFREYKAIGEPVDISLEEEGLRFKDADNFSLLKWSDLMKWRENEEFVLVYQHRALYHIIPRRLQNDGFDVVSLTEKLEEAVGPAT